MIIILFEKYLFSDFVSKYETCLHVKSLQEILSGFDWQNGIDACNFTLSDVLEGDHNYMVSFMISGVAG
jgi:hypothetical protein